MFELMIEDSFSAAHMLRNIKGRKEKIHGHNWKIQLYILSKDLNPNGVSVEFGELKNELRGLIEPLDQSYINEVFPFTEINPTSENLSKWIYDTLSKRLDTEDLEVSRIVVSEIAGVSATYFED
ncbi:MAG: 6-pyruvoyl trahydropterin synthase family protein [Nitrospiria bacterium]